MCYPHRHRVEQGDPTKVLSCTCLFVDDQELAVYGSESHVRRLSHKKVPEMRPRTHHPCFAPKLGSSIIKSEYQHYLVVHKKLGPRALTWPDTLAESPTGDKAGHQCELGRASRHPFIGGFLSETIPNSCTVHSVNQTLNKPGFPSRDQYPLPFSPPVPSHAT